MNELSIGRRVRAARRRHGLRQDELAALCGVGTRFVSELENGKPSLEIGRALRVIECLGMTVTVTDREWADIEMRDGD